MERNDSAAASPQPPASRASRKPKIFACERCNKRKVRCDASVRGLPCSECKSRQDTCRILQWKRSRGPNGQYVVPNQNEKNRQNESRLADLPAMGRTDADTAYQHEPPKETASAGASKSPSDPEMSFDIERLLRAEQDDGSDADSGHSQSNCGSITSASHGSTAQQGNRLKFAGESWFASFVVSISTASPVELHRLIERRTGNSQEDHERPGDAGSSSSSSRRSVPIAFPQHLTKLLIESYFQHFHVFCPILDQAYFLASVNDGSLSATLLHCVLFVASIHCPLELLHRMGYRTRLDAEGDLFSKACASFDAEKETDRTTMILSSYLLHYFSVTASNYRDMLWWLSNAIRSAQCMGLHRSTKNSKMPQRNKAHWRRIWWLLYIRDRQVSLSSGPPMVINDVDFDVEDLTMDDFPDEPPETARYVIAQASLNKAASEMFFCHCSPRRLHLSENPLARREARRHIQAVFEDWYANAVLPSSQDENHFLNLILKVCYHYYIINIQQRLQRLCHKPFRDSEGSNLVVQAADSVSNLVDDSLLHWSPERFPMIYISAIFTAMTAYVTDYGTSCPPKGVQLSQRLRPNLLALRQFEQCYNLARWVRNLFMEIISRQRGSPANEEPRDTEALHRTTSQTVEHRQPLRSPTTMSLFQDPTLNTSSVQGPASGPGDTFTSLNSTAPHEASNIPDSGMWNRPFTTSKWTSTPVIDPATSNTLPTGSMGSIEDNAEDNSWTTSSLDLVSSNCGGYEQGMYFLADLGLPELRNYDWFNDFNNS